MKLTSRAFFFLLLAAYGFSAFAQVTSIKGLINNYDILGKALPVEKVYLQLNKPSYILNDTIWFKGYLFNGTYLTPSTQSGILYLELDDVNNKAIKRIMTPVANGLTWGNFVLDGNIAEGYYTLRAYTNWMRNFGEDYVFAKSLYIAAPNELTHLITAKFEQAEAVNKRNIRAHMLVSGLDNKPQRLLDLKIDVMEGKRSLLKLTATTDVDGKLDINFDLPANANTKSLSISLQDAGKQTTTESAAVAIPVNLRTTGDIDLQFMPEGGQMVAGIPAKVGFKAINEDGMGADVSGYVYDSKRQKVSSFKSTYKGIGGFELMPKAGETYTAQIISPDSSVKTYPLPLVNTSGTALVVNSCGNEDTLQVHLSYIPQSNSDDNSKVFYLTGQSRGVICYAARLVLTGGKTIKIAKDLFPTGIAHFTLLNANFMPVNERISFIDHYDNLNVAMITKTHYAPNDSIGLQIRVTDKSGRPVKGNFSMTVTDDNQVKTDTAGDNIVSNLLLTSDLKGTVETPAHYFDRDTSHTIAQQLDNLMLTQGWVGYNWKAVLSPSKPPQFVAEQDFTVKGRVCNVFKKAVSNTHIILYSKKPFLLLDTVTDADGRFLFKNIVPVDTPIYLLQARNRKGNSFNVSVQVDEFSPPVFINKLKNNSMPWYINTDTAFMNAVRNNLTVKKQNENIASKGYALKEVKISAKKFIKDSQNLNGPGNADQVIDEKELEQAGKKTFLQVLIEKIPGFKEGFFPLAGCECVEKIRRDRILAAFIIDQPGNGTAPSADQYWYFVNGRPVKFIIDGISFYKVMSLSLPAITNINNYLTAHTAEDIKGVEVNSSSKYASRYVPMEWSELVGPGDVAFIEITTRSGGGPAIGNTPGTYLFKPMAFSIPRLFYQPKYTVKKKLDPTSDLRSTIEWVPNINTDTVGKTVVSFYGAGKTSTYTIMIEGIDKKGNVGFARKRIIMTDQSDQTNAKISN